MYSLFRGKEEIRIEEPTRRGRPTKYPFAYKQPGDHFRVPIRADSAYHRKCRMLAVRAAVRQIHRGACADWRFDIRGAADHIRVERL